MTLQSESLTPHNPIGAFLAMATLLMVLFIAALAYARGKGSRRAGTRTNYEVLRQRERTAGAEQILITGGSGFLGGNLVDGLLQSTAGAVNIHVFDVRVPDDGRRNKLVHSYIRGNVTEYEHVAKAMDGIDTVFHAAGVFSHDLNVAVTKEMTHSVNVIGTSNIVKACKEKGVKRLIFTSTCIATIGKDDQAAEGWTEEQPYPDVPVNDYVSSKIAAEKTVLKANAVNGLATCVVRPAGMFGIGDNIMADMALRGTDNYYIGDGTAKLDIIDVQSAVHGHLCAARHLRPAGNKAAVAAGKIYNITSGGPIMYKEFFGGLCKERESFWGHRPPKKIPVWLARLLASINETIYNAVGVIPFARSFTRLSVEMTQRTFWFDNSLAAREIGYAPLKPWRSAVDEIVKSYSLKSRQRRRSVTASDIP
eukprot:m.14819 g.14819  ORF g.14819 m.14819 type:complete len:422 (+) comp25987_c0_seq2:96-1361(+)